MEAQKSEGVTGCDHKCGDCSSGHHTMPTSGGDLAGMKLVAAGALVFLFPLILAILGVMFAGGGQTRQVLGAMIGLVIGVFLAVLVVRLLKKTNRDLTKCDIEEIKEHR